MIKYSRAQMSSTQKGKRTTVSLTDVVSGMADQSMKDDGYDNFSAYVAELIRRDYKARHKTKREKPQSTARYPEHKSSAHLNEDVRRHTPKPKEEN